MEQFDTIELVPNDYAARHKSTELAPDERTAVERLLGRPLQSDEMIEVVTSSQPAECERDQRRIWDVITERMKAVPPEVFDRLPKDGASEHDHYLYGSPKRNH
jgi:PAS domain-containing protein